jgi:hypothetical protein
MGGTQGIAQDVLPKCYAPVMMLKFPVSETDAGNPRPRRCREEINACTIPISDCVRSLRNFPTSVERYECYDAFQPALLACIDQALSNDTSAIAALTELDHDERFRSIPDALRGEHDACVEVAKALDALAYSAHARAVRALSTKPVGPVWITPGDPAEEILDRLLNPSRKKIRKKGQ